MKIKNIVFFTLVVMSISVANAAKLMVGIVAVGKKTPRSVDVFWKDGSSGYIELRETRTLFSSPWNRDIIGVRWYDIGPDNLPKYYDYPLYIPAVRAPWLKDAWLIIEDDGYIRFDIGKGLQNGKALLKKERKQLEKEGWGVID